MKWKFALVALVVLIAGVTPVYAANPHFNSASASVAANGALNVSWKEAGLGNNVLISYVANADSTAIYACVNGGGNHPKAGNKETVSGPVSGTGTFSSGKNGPISQTLALGPLGAGGFTCPSGQRLVLAKVSYTNASITDTTDNITQAIPGTFCRQFVNLPDFACP
jgi:hypothetical protein